MDEEKERQKEIKEKLESEGLDPEEFDEDEQEELADLLKSRYIRKHGKERYKKLNLCGL